MQWTEAQQQIIDLRNKNILVSAAAGSGKTAVLIERIKQLILRDHVEIDRFLITTFTNAASAEMRERLEQAIRAELEQPNADRAFLRQQLNLIPRANIGTFHNFALEIIRRYFYLTDLEPGFQIGDEVQVSILKNAAIDQLFEQRFESDYERFGTFLKKYSSDRSERRLKENMLSLYNELRSVPEYFAWAQEQAALLRTAEESPLTVIGLRQFVLQETMRRLNRAASCYEKAAELLEEEGLAGLAAKAFQDLEKVAALAEQMQLYCSTDQRSGEIFPADSEEAQMKRLRAFLEKPGFHQMRAAKEEKETYEGVKELVSDYRKQGKKELDDLRKKYFARTFEEYDEELRQQQDDTAYLIMLLQEFEQLFREKKQEKNLVDFDDVMHYAIEILKNDMVAAEYRERFAYIFIDEFQDSNMLQETIVQRICRKENLFMVGDVKQSIYKFRLAEPELFRSKYLLYQQDSEPDSMKIDLNSNFRSKQYVTDTVNCVFAAVMDGYDDNASLHCTADPQHPGYETELHLIDLAAQTAEGDVSEEIELLENSNMEAALLAQLVREQIGLPIYDRKTNQTRPAEYRDIVVLFRSRNRIAELEQYFNNEGIPAYGEPMGGYFETVEIQVFLNLMRLIDNSRQDIPLISVMHSAIFGFSVRELASVRIAFPEGSYYEAVVSYAEKGTESAGDTDDALQKKIIAMQQKLDYWKELRKAVSLEELVRTLIYETGYYDYCRGLPLGKKRAANLQLLIERAAAFEQKNYSGLYGFLSYVEAMKQNRIVMGEARVAGAEENVVQIMTIHKSKGLEFPIVILAGTGRTIKFKGAGSPASMHKDFGIGLLHVNAAEHWHRKTLLQRVIEGKKAQEELEEEIRILYVALTRAMDKLLIAGTVKDAEQLERGISGKGSFLEMVYEPLMEAGGKIFRHLPQEQIDRADSQQLQRIPLRERMNAEQIRRKDSIYAEIDRRFSLAQEQASRVKSKYSVTELNAQESGGLQESLRSETAHRELTLAKPGFLGERRILSAAEIGTAMHLVMEKTDFKTALIRGVAYIEQVVAQLQEDELLSDEEAAALNVHHIAAFFAQEQGRRAAQAETLQKEREFILQKELEGVPTIVQGIIDCYFEEADGLVLIDYKNSYVEDAFGEAVLAERYRQQLELYREALEAATGKRVKESWLYLFRAEKFIAAGGKISK